MGALVSSAASSAQAVTISLGWGGFPVELFTATSTMEGELNPTVVPWSDSHVAESNGDRSEVSYVIGPDRFDALFEQSNAETAGSLTSAKGWVRFTVDEAVNAVFGGQFDTSGPVRRVYQRVWLRGGSATLYLRTQESRSTADESFSVGLQEGDYFNDFFGGDSIMLVPGTQYFLIYDYFVQVLPSTGDAAGPATATGSFTMILPEPGTALLIGLGLALAMRAGKHGKR